MIRPPSLSTSLSRNVTPCSAAAAWIARDERIECVGCRLGALRRDDLVESRETDERDRAVAVLALERPDLEKLRAERRRDRQLESDARRRRESG